MSLVHIVFLSHSPVIRYLPSLFTGFPGQDFPAFFGTMKILRLPSLFSLPSVSLGVDTCCSVFFLTLILRTEPVSDRTFGHPSVLFLREAATGSGRLSQVPMIPLCTFALFLDPGRAHLQDLLSKLVLSPLTEKGRPRTTHRFRGSIAWLLHSLSTLHAHISMNYARLASG